MSFDYDAFISYSHIDNVGLVDGGKGWITNLHRALEIRIAQFLGEQPHIWRDPKLTGNDVFESTLVQQLGKVAALITVVSPRYVRSEWTRRELVEFWRAAEAQGGVVLHDKARIFKVMKTPIPRELDLPQLQPLLGYEFFKIDESTARVREFDEIFGAEAQRDFWMKLDDLAHDICDMLEILRRESLSDCVVSEAPREAIYLAETSRDLAEQRETIRRELQQHGYLVFPVKGLPLNAFEMRTTIEHDLARCRMAIHMVGSGYNSIEDNSTSTVEMQNRLAIERGRAGGLTRLLWIPAAITTDDDRQKRVIEQFRMDASMQHDGDLLETPLEELRTVIFDRLKESTEPAQQVSKETDSEDRAGQIYILYEQRDESEATTYADALFDAGFEVLHPCFEGDEAEIRQCHEENLRFCDGALIVFGTTHAGWVRQKLREMQKSVGYGRPEPLRKIAISCVGAKTSEKETFRTHEAMILKANENPILDCLQPFIAQMKH